MKESVLLINTPLSEFPQRESEESLPPLGLGYIATGLRKKKIHTELLDALAEHKSIQEIITQIEEQDYTHVGMNIFSTNAHLVKKIMQSIKRELIFILG